MKDEKEVKRYHCINYGACAKADSGEMIEIDVLETIGGTPECPCCHQHTLEEIVKKGPNWKLIAIVAAVVLVLGGGMGYYFGIYQPQQKEQAVKDAEAARIKAERQQKEAEEAARRAAAEEAAKAAAAEQGVAEAEAARQATEAEAARKTAEEAEDAKPKAKVAPQSKNPSWGRYEGPRDNNGLPHGTGVMRITRSTTINGQTAQPGERIEGVFRNGYVNLGTWYQNDGNAVVVKDLKAY
ncbi:MAG: hypothetical protein J6M25_06080 [Prevotella sp.]|nr:hypothetical protein [Prevotella sp.]